MTDCQDAAIQDQLPDFVAGALDVGLADTVRQHLAHCAACAADVGLLRQLQPLRVEVPSVDPARIAAAVRAAHPRRGASSASTIPSMARRQPPRWRPGLLRMAATVLVCAGAAAAWRQLATPSGRLVAVADTSASLSEDTARLGRSAGSEVVFQSVSYGDLGDYTAEEMQTVLARLDAWDGAPSEEPLGTLPVVTTAAGHLP
jgi:anti-sigma factor RsiW